MTPDERIKHTLGDLIVQNAILQSEVETLKAKLAAVVEPELNIVIEGEENAR